MEVTFTLTGHDRLTDSMKQIAKYSAEASMGDLAEAVQPMWREAQNTVPVDTGNLEQSGWFQPTQDTPTYKEVQMGYSAPYAFAVHEGHRIVIPNGHGGLKELPTPAPARKWLENAVLAGIPGMESSLSGKTQSRADSGDWTTSNTGAFEEGSQDSSPHNKGFKQ